jgi:hypothetical protein
VEGGAGWNDVLFVREKEMELESLLWSFFFSFLPFYFFPLSCFELLLLFVISCISFVSLLLCSV